MLDRKSTTPSGESEVAVQQPKAHILVYSAGLLATAMAVQGVEGALPGVEQLRRVAMPLSGGSVIMYVGIRAVNDQVNIHGLPEFDISILQLSGQEVEDVDSVLATGPEHGRQVIGQTVTPGEPSSDHGVLPSDEEVQGGEGEVKHASSPSGDVLI
ncbi:hypothetical protein PG988_011361 [Apiospora saccharicola]